MIWKVYKMMAYVLFRCAVVACFSHTYTGRPAAEFDKLNRLNRIIKHIRQYYSLHPNFAKDTYKTVENYLQQHVSEQDWALLNQLQVIKPIQAPTHHNPVLDIA